MPRDQASSEPLLGHSNGQSARAGNNGGFAYTVEDLAPLTDPTSPKLPSQMGGIAKICEGLKVDPKVGLHTDEAGAQSTGSSDQVKFAARSKAFGRNVSVSTKRAIEANERRLSAQRQW